MPDYVSTPEDKALLSWLHDHVSSLWTAVDGMYAVGISCTLHAARVMEVQGRLLDLRNHSIDVTRSMSAE